MQRSETIGYKKYMESIITFVKGEKTMSTKKTLFNNAESFIEELSDEELTACVGGNSEEPSFVVNATVKTSITYNDTDLSPQYIWPLRPSDRNIKEHFAAVDEQEILSKVAKLPIETWNYKEQNPAVRHIGPMSQDFAAAFGVGESDRHINLGDANGVALAAIQALYNMLLEKDAQITSLRADLNDLKQQVIDSKAMTSVAMLAVAPAATFIGACTL